MEFEKSGFNVLYAISSEPRKLAEDSGGARESSDAAASLRLCGSILGSGATALEIHVVYPAPIETEMGDQGNH